MYIFYYNNYKTKNYNLGNDIHEYAIRLIDTIVLFNNVILLFITIYEVLARKITVVMAIETFEVG